MMEDMGLVGKCIEDQQQKHYCIQSGNFEQSDDVLSPKNKQESGFRKFTEEVLEIFAVISFPFIILCFLAENRQLEFHQEIEQVQQELRLRNINL